ncbi:FCP1 homology domain containing protein [uncultured Caudovirales phage]|uniref:FCP1 homology domain containing protein n=1 Tax=uncultured Caudovirales phage TaxID=2100421 RepID=A0A6J5QEZ9_9CAUD|nr:FCP1 homology domain containing protein [uncultured Caudovirales phage]CAB4176283.1 FCP1 homology domain containing protein [uncultured Caudovirales phage]CAB4183049.1 FCP1 homology domain containing protein [uncultured Caudovirales phage]CAB4198057.1 FCP1 homology domain containing protein [uncultured Caudovirales phage]CAB4212445.1 FCP1 homology domain containing protein [uncultured Caudovirales phage]
MIVFDLDGTLANFDHRKHIVSGKSRDDKSWELFYQACIYDRPIYPVVNVFTCLYFCSNIEVQIWTGRNENYKEQTLNWIEKHAFGGRLPLGFDSKIKMRARNDTRHDWEIKQQWLKDESPNVELVYEDRNSVVEMFRRNNVICVQVAEGAY